MSPGPCTGLGMGGAVQDQDSDPDLRGPRGVLGQRERWPGEGRSRGPRVETAEGGGPGGHSAEGWGAAKAPRLGERTLWGGWEVGLGWRGEGAAQERPAGSLVDLIPRAWALQLQPHGRARGWL